VARRALVDPALASELGLSETERELAAIDPGYPQLLVIGRLDMLVTADGYHFIELNADSPAGVTDQTLVEQSMARLPHLAALRERHAEAAPGLEGLLLSGLCDAYRAFTPGGPARPRIAIVDFTDGDTRAELEILAQVFRQAGHEVVLADPEELRFAGGRLHAAGAAVDLVYRRVLVQELLARHGRSHPLIEAYRAGAVCVANSFRTRPLNKKAAFAALTDPRFSALFSREQRAAIARHVPWTRKLEPGATEWRGRRVELLELLRHERERFVLKPNDGYGGEGVLLGFQTSAAAWEDALARAGQGELIVQERLVPTTLRMPTYRDGLVFEEVYFDLCPFVISGRACSAMVRLSRSPLTNVSAGGGVSTVYLVDDAKDASAARAPEGTA
jgi:hypothetical protein